MFRKNFVTFLFSPSLWGKWIPKSWSLQSTIALDLSLWNHERPGQVLLILSWLLFLGMTGDFYVLDVQAELFISSINTKILTDMIKCMNSSIACHLIDHFSVQTLVYASSTAWEQKWSWFNFCFCRKYICSQKVANMTSRLCYTCSFSTVWVVEKKARQISTLGCWLSSLTTQYNSCLQAM